MSNRLPKANGQSHRVRFTPKLWAAWIAGRTPNEADARRARDITEFRKLLQSKTVTR